MKYLLVFLLIMCISSCDGQKSSIDSLIFVKGVLTSTSAKDSVAILGSGYGFVGDGGTILFHKQDTIKVLMLVCDTSESSGYGNRVKIATDLYRKEIRWAEGVWWQVGHEVCGPLNNMLWHRNLRISYTESGFPYIVKEYLDQNKKPLSRNIVVFLTKEIKSQ